MHIGYISYEYPPDTAVGGISTYVYQVSQVMKNRGHTVEVFCASYERTVSEWYEGILVHRIRCGEPERMKFSGLILQSFSERHTVAPFDLIESPEYSADGLAIKQQYPDLTLIVKLHTPHYLIRTLSCHYDTFYKRAYYILANMMTGKFVRPYWLYLKKKNDPDFHILALADQIHTPSVSLGQIVLKKWGISQNKIVLIPYPYIPKPELLSISTDTDRNVVTFIGRLEVRKGLVALCKAIPLVLQKKPAVKFRFSGATAASPVPGMDMMTYITQQLESCTSNIEFLHVPADKVHEVYAGTDICVFPSIWENFPNVCLEAMSGARGIVASKEGGMKDMLEDPKCGLLVDPLDSAQIAQAILYLIDNPGIRKELGLKAREEVLQAYNSDLIGRLMEDHYLKAIEKKRLHS